MIGARRMWRRALAGICLVMVSCQGWAAVQLRIVEDIHYVAAEFGKKQTPLPPDVHGTETVLLEGDYLSVVGDSATRIFDFGKRRVLVLDHKHKSYVESSLYAIPGLAATEMKNLESLRTRMGAAKLSLPGSLADDEQQLSMLSSTPATVEVGDDGEERVFRCDGKELVRWTHAGVAQPASVLRAFSMFVRLTAGGHPTVLAALDNSAFVPQRISVTLDRVVKQVVTLTLLDAKRVDSSEYSLQGYAPRVSDESDPVNAALDRAAALDPAGQYAAASTVRQGIDQAFQEGRLGDALLGVAEHGLMTGRPDVGLTDAQKDALKSSPDATALAAVMGSFSSKEDLQRAVSTLAAAKEKAPQKAYMLMLFEANDRLRLQEFGEAQRLFLEVLKHNPRLALGYKDFGDLLFVRFDIARAWMSWDAGRRLVNGPCIFQSVDSFEKALAKNYPEYFAVEMIP